MFHGLSVQKCCTLAYQFALRNKLNIPDSLADNSKAGTDWWLAFRSRQHLAVRSPFARSSAFNHPVVNQFYDNLATVMDANHFQPEDIFNCSETGCTTMQCQKQVVTEQGRKQVGSIMSSERGESLLQLCIQLVHRGMLSLHCLSSRESTTKTISSEEHHRAQLVVQRDQVG